MSSKKAKPVDRAVPLMRKPRKTDAQKVATTTTTVNAMQGTPLWNANPALQASANDWSTKSGAIGSNAALIEDLKSKLAKAQANQRTLRRDWEDSLKHVLANVATVTQGSADQVHELGFDVRTHATPGGLLPAPTGFAMAHTKVPGEVVVKWEMGDAKHGFIVQRAPDVANPATISAPIPCTRAKYTLKGVTAGSMHLRVAAIDPASELGQSPWSDWVTVVAP
jgi:hypothetical protein